MIKINLLLNASIDSYDKRSVGVLVALDLFDRLYQ